jgi:hypothetical protein
MAIVLKEQHIERAKALATGEHDDSVARRSMSRLLIVATTGMRARPLATGLLFLSWCFAVYASSRLKTGLLEPQYTDYLRHASYGLEFLRSGFGMYSKVTREIAPIAGHMVWPDITYLYPPGALLLFSPLTIAIRAGVPATEAARYLVVALITITHIAAYQLNLGLSQRLGSPMLRGIAVLMFVSFGGFWSLNGQYDAVPALFIILAGKSSTDDRCLIWSAAAIAVKFQSLLVAPYVIARLSVSLMKGRLRRPKTFTMVVLILTAVTVLPSLFILREQLSPVMQNRLAWNQWGPSGLVFTSMTAAFVVYLLIKRDWVEAALLFGTYAAISLVAVFQMWYAVIPLALLTHYARPRRWEVHAAWFLGFCMALQWWPNPQRVWQLLVGA